MSVALCALHSVDKDVECVLEMYESGAECVCVYVFVFHEVLSFPAPSHRYHVFVYCISFFSAHV